MAGAARGLQRALDSGAVALGQARAGGAFWLPGGCTAREQARRSSSPTPPEESAEGGGPGAASGSPKADVNVRLACLESDMKYLRDSHKELKDDVRKVMAGDTPFFKELKQDMGKVMAGDTPFFKELAANMRAAVRWYQGAAGFAACASLFAAYALHQTAKPGGRSGSSRQ